MKKIIPIFIMALILLCSIIVEDVSAETVFLTSDNVLGHDEDFKMLNEIADYIETKSDGQIEVIVDSEASSPGEGTRAMNARCDYVVTIAHACAGNLLDLAEYSTKTDKTIIYVNAGGLDLNSINFLRRSYDDNWSQASFAAILKPGTFLTDAGIIVLQPGQEYPDLTSDGSLDYSSSTINEYIADNVINTINSGNVQSRQLDSNLIVAHSLSPSYLAEDSQKIVNSKGGDMLESYGSYTTQQLLYMSASYLAGYSLEMPGEYEAPDNPEKSSFFTKGSYSFNDYTQIADLVVDYMNENGKAPDYIDYNGARIGYYDLVYNFALLTEDDVDAAHMNFQQSSDFERFYDNGLLDYLPIAVIIFIIIIALLIFRKIRNKIKNRRNGRNTRKRGNRAKNYQNSYYNQSYQDNYYNDGYYPDNRKDYYDNGYYPDNRKDYYNDGYYPDNYRNRNSYYQDDHRNGYNENNYGNSYYEEDYYRPQQKQRTLRRKRRR